MSHKNNILEIRSKHDMPSFITGDPTVFGNLPTAESAMEAVIKATQEQKCNGYAPSIGMKIV